MHISARQYIKDETDNFKYESIPESNCFKAIEKNADNQSIYIDINKYHQNTHAIFKRDFFLHGLVNALSAAFDHICQLNSNG